MISVKTLFLAIVIALAVGACIGAMIVDPPDFDDDQEKFPG